MTHFFLIFPPGILILLPHLAPKPFCTPFATNRKRHNFCVSVTRIITNVN